MTGKELTPEEIKTILTGMLESIDSVEKFEYKISTVDGRLRSLHSAVPVTMRRRISLNLIFETKEVMRPTR